MAFIESPRFPEAISYGALSGPEFQTDVIIVNSGYESRNSNWETARAKFDVGHRGRTKAETDTLVAFFRSMKGRAHGFRFKDWTDYQVTHANGRLIKLPELKFQLSKRYTTGTLNENRLIKKPISVSVIRNGIPITRGLSAGQYQQDLTTGVLTFNADLWHEISSVTKSNPGVVTTDSPHGFNTGDLIDLKVTNGMSELDKTRVTISVLSTKSFSIGVNTTHFSTYIASGRASKTIQPSETVTWQGEFDVPCRFDTDTMQIEIVDKDIYSWGQIPIVEIRS
jgi:uncharacterized protein (TIGR02217 family)